MQLTKKLFSKLIFLGGFGILIFSSLVNLYDNKERFQGKLDLFKLQDKSEIKRKFTKDFDKYWVNQLKEGGYIVYMRHAERNKWLYTGMFDAAEISENRRGENEYFEDFVCLNNKGKIQAKMIKEFIKKHGMKISQVISSPSCRARQTAEIGFGKIDIEDKVLVYESVFDEDKNIWQQKLRKFFDQLNIEEESNIVITAHGRVIFKTLFDNNDELKNTELPSKIKEGGFYVISKNNGELKLEHQFINFKDFSKYINTRY